MNGLKKYEHIFRFVTLDSYLLSGYSNEKSTNF